MFVPATSSDIGPEAAQPERETVIKFVISGPFLNAEAAHTQWAAEPPPTAAAMNDLVRRIADLERKLDEERALVRELSRQMPVPAPPAAPDPVAAPEPVAEPAALVAPLPAKPFDEPPTRTTTAPAPRPLSTVVRTPPPKVRGLRRMIGALRHL